ncbi:hypothetical protein GKZ89_16335 [Bacillus mangrovi]|uniref:Uncharacterized protein n=1 Tax=Metabacillus mangrovi TaxID=1491830 RepID=A0A7X2V5M5_9BACI|nr:hypothetical protein [Metabacillus mangrovi]MTH54972.1 hypothetical protein [Metabacillus mangrovi]
MDNLGLAKLIQESVKGMTERMEQIENRLEGVEKKLEDVYVLVKDTQKTSKNLQFDIDLIGEKMNTQEKLLNRVYKHLELE